MSLFKKKKGNLEEQGFSVKKPNYFKEIIETRKVKLAVWLGQKTAGWSREQKKAALIIFCVISGAISFYILIGSFHGHVFTNRSLVITHLRSGVHSPPRNIISDSVFHRAESTRAWLDSLKQNDTARFRAVLLSRPLLINNIELIEKIYQSQFNLQWNKAFIRPGF